MLKNLTFRDNVCIAAQDIDGDGKVEVAVGAQWNPGNTTDPEESGSVHYLIRPADPSATWDGGAASARTNRASHALGKNGRPLAVGGIAPSRTWK